MSHARLLVWMPLGTGSAWIPQMIKNGYPRLLLSTSRSQSHCSPCSYPHHTELPRQHPGSTRRWWQRVASQTVRTAADRHAPRLTPQRKSRRAGRRNTPANTLNAPPKRSRPRSRSSARKRFAIIAETVGGERFANHHHVGDVRGRGLVQAIGLVLDRASKATFDPKHQLA